MKRILSSGLVLPVVALASLSIAGYHVHRTSQTEPPLEPPVPPARSPYNDRIAAAGITEARTENIAVGAHTAGVVVEVHVKVGQKVKPNDVLFRLDDRQLVADLAVKEAQLVGSEAELAKLQDMPRPEEVPPSQAKLDEAKARVVDLEDTVRRSEKVLTSKAVAQEEFIRQQQALQVALHQLARAKAEHALLLAGAWEADKKVARANSAQARAGVKQILMQLERLNVRALVEAEVLQVNVRPGEFVGTPPNQALVVLGDVRKLHIRVDIDEHDIARFRTSAKATACVRGDAKRMLPLTFVRVEPYVIPKKSLTGDNAERVDTRVLQVIYAVEMVGNVPLYVGQQMDVFIEAPPP
jgi:multidrug efflux pump subunit AcrA (membrane-fusion protein)